MANEIQGINIKALQLRGKEQVGGNEVKTDETNLKDGLSQKELSEIDTNKDGYLTEEEFKAAMKKNGGKDSEITQYWGEYLTAFQQKNQKENKTVSQDFDKNGNMTSYKVSKSNNAKDIETTKTTGTGDNSKTYVRYGSSKTANKEAIAYTSGNTEVLVDKGSSRVRSIQSSNPAIDISGISYLATVMSTTRFDQITINGETYKGSNLSRNGDIVTVKNSAGKTIAEVTIGSDRHITKIALDFSDGKAQTEITLDKTGKPQNVASTIKTETANAATEIEKFDNWTNSLDPNSKIQYVELGNSAEEFIANLTKFATDYVNKFGNNDGNLSLEEFINFTGLNAEDANAIFKMIDMNGKDGISSNEFATYLMAVDRMDGIADGNMTLENYNDSATFAIFADEKYKNTELHQVAAKGLETLQEFMTRFSSYFGVTSSNETVSVKTTAAEQSDGNLQTKKNDFNNMIKAYQDAYCTDDVKSATLPDNLYETLSQSLPVYGDLTIKTDDFIAKHYSGVSNVQKTALKQTFEGLNEINSGIRLYDISKNMILYSLLNDNGIALSKENLEKAQSAINGKNTFTEIEQAFKTAFNISIDKTHSLLSSIGDDWMKVQTDYAFKSENT